MRTVGHRRTEAPRNVVGKKKSDGVYSWFEKKIYTSLKCLMGKIRIGI